MEAVDRFHLQPQAPDTLRSILTATDGSSLEVEGQVMEKQFRCSLGYLVITSDGIPFEEALHFYLLSPDGEFLDGISLGHAYNSGILRDLSVGDNTLDFSFFGTERWRLSICDSPDALLAPNPWASVRSIRGWLRGHYLRLDRRS
jgi:hypothetical protein